MLRGERRDMLRTLLPLLLLSYASGTLPQLGPAFVVEPPSLVQYPAGSGARVRCVARGDPPPTLAWLSADGTPLDDAPGLRRIYSNGTLEMLPRARSYGATVDVSGAPATVRCRAANAHGVALSRDVTLQPVAEVSWEAVVLGGHVSEGGVAALTCGAGGAGGALTDKGLVRAALWYRDDRLINIDAPTTESRYVVAGNTLLIRDAAPADAGPYSCLARHSLTAVTKRSRPHHLAVTSGSTGSAPRLVSAAGEVTVAAGTDFCLPCVASDHPAPQYTWYRESNGRLQPVEASTGTAWAWAWGGGAALCFTRVSRAVAGAWLCKAYNVFGDATAQMRLQVQDTLTVTVSPSVVVAETGSTVVLNCTASDPSARLRWVHDGAAAGAGGVLTLRGVARAHRGLYQCFATRPHDAAHATTELRLGDSPPELHYTFIEQALRAGGDVSLRCAASGSPHPRFSWLLDNQPLDQFRPQHRFFVSEETSVNGDVVSVLNMSAVTAADGGRYTCRAHNPRGDVHHSARLNIYGPPSIRALGPVRVVAGANATIFCPYAGYPIRSIESVNEMFSTGAYSSISWWRRGASVAVGGAGRAAARGAELRLAPALPPDAGHYACAVAAPQGPAARTDIEIQVRNPPKISPFIFSSELTEGSSVQVLCGVSSGDKPMYFSWFKDDAPLPSNLQIEEKSLNEFSLLMFSDLTARHSGEYTCRVSNHAATVNYTATLSVKVAPAWIIEPLDAAVLLGSPLLLECAAKGYPTPVVTWYRRIGEGVGLSPEGSDQWEQVGSGQWSADESDGVVRARNGSLSAAAATRAYQGLYRCIADNGVGPPLLKHVNVTVHEPAHFEELGGNVSCVRGHSASLVCYALGDAPLAVHWSHRGTRLDLNSYRWTVSETRTADGVRSTLQLRAAERADSGEYRCHANNQYGRSERLMYLQVEEPPEAPRAPRLSGVGSRWVRVSWRAPPPPARYSAIYTALHALPVAAGARHEPRHSTVNLTLDSLLDDRVDSDGFRTLSTKLEGLQPAAAYSLRLVATNHVGQSPHSDPLLFTTLEEAPTASPQNVRVRPVNPGELLVSWSSPPQENWNGELLGYVASWRELGRLEGPAGVGEVQGDDIHAGSLTSPGWSSVELTLASLRTFARYAITLRAYNRAGAGPPSPTVYATTADGIPEVPPTSVTCEGVSARTLRVRWLPPHVGHAHALRGFDLHYVPLHFSPSWSGVGSTETQTARAGVGGEATLQGLRAATNYSVWVRARSDRGLGPPSPPVYCTTREDVPGAVEAVRSLVAGADAVRITWLAPSQRAGVLTHYTLYTRELGKVGGEWSQRVETDEGDGEVVGEVWREVRGLRERTVYEFWVRAATAAGIGPPSRLVTAAPGPAVSARISSFSRVVYVSRGSRVRLQCAAVGSPPLRWRWTPLPHPHTITDAGDLIIQKVELSSGGNYTCSVRNSGGSDATVVSVRVRSPPGAPAPRLTRADMHALHLAWDPPPDGGAILLGYTVWWSREEVAAGSAGGTGGAGGSVQVPAGDTVHAVCGLACGARYRVTLRAHNLVGASPHSRPLLARTRGDKAKAPPGKEFVWANSTMLRLNLLSWGSRCPVTAWSVALRPAAGGDWLDLVTDGETAEARDLRPGSWYEIRVVARSPAGDTTALYRAATHTHNGERIGEAVEVALEGRISAADGAGSVEGVGGAEGTDWRASLAPALLGGGLAALLAALAGLILIRRRSAASCLRRECSLHQVCQPHPQLYTTEPSKRNGKTLTPPDGDLHEISPYATFSMSGGTEGGGGGGGGGGGVGVAGGAGGCALHLRTFARAEALDLAAPPPRPNLLTHSAEYGRSRDSDSESSGSPCAACAAELYRLPAAHLSDTLPAVESSAEDTSYSAGGGGRGTGGSVGGGGGTARGQRARAARRRDHARHSSATGPTVRYFSPAAVAAMRRHDAL